MSLKNFDPAGSGETVQVSGGHLIDTLTSRARIFLFSYSIKYKSVISWSDNSAEVLGVKDFAIARDGNLFLRHVHPDDRYLLMTDLEQALNQKKEYRATYRWIRPDNNEVRWLHCRAGSSSHEGDILFEGMIIDLSNEFTGEVSQLAGPDSVGAILAAFPAMVFTIDRDMRLLRINRSRFKEGFDFGDPNFKLEQFRIGRPLLSSFSDKDLRENYQRILQDLLDGKNEHYRSRITLGKEVYSLEIMPLSNRGIIEGLLFNISDITESVRLEQHVSQLQKIEGLGLLAAGVAHNFNNALQGILGQAAILVNHPENKELVKQAGSSIMDIVDRSSDLTRQLIVFNEKNTGSQVPSDLNTVAMAAMSKVQDLFGNGIKVAVTFGSTPKVSIDEEQLVEALEAIIRNAKESIPADHPSPASITVRTSSITLADMEINDLKGGSYAKVSISDSGRGMADTTKNRCLEPFFTTKERDPETGVGIKSVGLGLSKAFAIVRKQGGGITVESKEGVGTVVCIYLPAIERENSTKDDSLPIATIVPNPEILVIDDDRMVLDTIGRLLSDLNYRCVTAEDANRAFSLLRSHHKSIKLVLLDAVMPGMDGAQVLKELKRLNKDLKVIGFSGAPPEQTKPLLENGALQVLRKPIGPEKLRQAIELALNPLQLVANN